MMYSESSAGRVANPEFQNTFIIYETMENHSHRTVGSLGILVLRIRHAEKRIPFCIASGRLYGAKGLRFVCKSFQ